jgi:hypothetical protein
MSLERIEFHGTLEHAMNPNLLDLDPALMQKLATQVKENLITRSADDIKALQTKRKNSGKPTLRQTRDQRAFDVRVKSLKQGDNILHKLRALAVGNYFVVPATEAVAVRNMTARELRERGIKYNTTKFVFGRHEYIKVHRHNPIHDKDDA